MLWGKKNVIRTSGPTLWAVIFHPVFAHFQDLLWRRRHLQWDAIFNLAQAVEENLADMDMGYYQHLMVSK